MAKDNNKKESYQEPVTQIYYSNKLNFRTIDSQLKSLSNKPHLFDQLATDLKDSRPIRFYIYFAKGHRIKLELVSLN